LMIFKEGLLKHFACVPFGAESLTIRIARELGVSRDLAEDVKRSYARVGEAAMAGPADEFLIKKEDAFVPVNRALLVRAVEANVLELSGHLRTAIEASGLEGQMKAGVVVAGGGALLSGLIERIETSLQMPVSLGRSVAGLNNAAVYCTATALAEMAYKGSARYVFDTRAPKDWVDALRLKAEEISNEYF
ncbi:MAG: rod shape-determining protein, partial [Candidatus Omnitrophica bacterium]|nr:rod shape-determining protein [Candidatus Omnitrophota bacterium]